MSAKTNVVIERAPVDEPTFRAVLALLQELHTHVGMAPINPDKLARNCYAFLSEGMTFLARVVESGTESGEIIGSLGLVWCDHYYSDWRFLQDKWFYVKPAWRSGEGGRGRAGVKLLLAARREAIARETIAFVVDTNPKHKRNREATGIDRALRELGFMSAGYVLRLQGLKGPLSGGIGNGLVLQHHVIDDNGASIRF